MSSKLDSISPERLACNPRASLSSWHRYENIVAEAFRLHPKTYEFSPVGLAPASVASKLRDAVRGAIAFSYPSAIPLDDLRRWWSEVVVRFDDNRVYITPAGSRPLLSPLEIVDTDVPAVHNISDDDFSALLRLLSLGHIHGPFRVLKPLPAVPSPYPNVETLLQPDGTLLVF